MLRNPELAARVASLRAQNAALRDALDPVLTEPIPAHLLAAAVPVAPRATRLRRSLMPALGLAATLLVGIGLGWLLRSDRARRALPQLRAAGRVRARSTRGRQPAGRDLGGGKRLVNWLASGWGSGESARPQQRRVALVGGRLVAGNENRALHVRERRQAAPVAADLRGRPRVLTRARSVTPRRMASACSGSMTPAAALSGNVDRAQLLKIAHVVYGQLAAVRQAAPSSRFLYFPERRCAPLPQGRCLGAALRHSFRAPRRRHL